MGYWVKWKDYGEEENSWVNEDDIGCVLLFLLFCSRPANFACRGAQELVEAFWKRKGLEDKKKSGSVVKSRKSLPAQDAESGSTATKKRGRKSAAAKEEEDVKPAKKQKQHKSVSEEVEIDEHIGDMNKYRNTENWEKLVLHIDTVEFEATSKTLYVYFTLCVFSSLLSSSPNGTVELVESGSRSLQRNARGVSQ